jgi:hypothetical protein
LHRPTQIFDLTLLHRLLELALQVVGHVPELADGMAEAAHQAR